MITPAATFNEGILTDGLLLHVDANDRASFRGNGTEWRNLAGTVHGALTNSPTWNSSGYFNFDGTNDYVNFTVNPLHSNSVTEFSVSFWMNCTLADMNAGIGVVAVTAPGADPTGGGFWIAYDDRNATHSPAEGIAWNSRTAGGYQRGKSNDNTISNDTWHNVTLVLDQQVTCYIDGVSSTNRTQDSSGDYVTKDHEFQLGSIDAAYLYNGLLANTLVYNKGLTNSEVLHNFNAQRHRFGR